MNLRLFVTPSQKQDLRWAMMWREVVTTPQPMFDLQLGMIRVLLRSTPPTALTRRKEIETDERLMVLEMNILRMLDRHERIRQP